MTLSPSPPSDEAALIRALRAKDEAAFEALITRYHPTLVRLGQGVSLVPAMAVPKGRDDGREYRSLTGDKPTRTIALAWNRMRYQTQLFKRFVEFVSART